MKLTKKSLAALKKYGRIINKNLEPSEKYDYRIGLIIDILLKAEIICGSPDECFELYNTENTASCTISKGQKPLFVGMETRYGYECISCTFTNGLNWVEIVDPNKLIRKIVKEIAENGQIH